MMHGTMNVKIDDFNPLKLAHHIAYSRVIHSMNKTAEAVMHMTYVWEDPV
jgi:hypothetical protein